jgi:hypothetical protein
MARHQTRRVAAHDETADEFWGEGYPPVARSLLTLHIEGPGAQAVCSAPLSAREATPAASTSSM